MTVPILVVKSATWSPLFDLLSVDNDLTWKIIFGTLTWSVLIGPSDLTWTQFGQILCDLDLLLDPNPKDSSVTLVEEMLRVDWHLHYAILLQVISQLNNQM